MKFKTFLHFAIKFLNNRIWRLLCMLRRFFTDTIFRLEKCQHYFASYSSWIFPNNKCFLSFSQTFPFLVISPTFVLLLFNHNKTEPSFKLSFYQHIIKCSKRFHCTFLVLKGNLEINILCNLLPIVHKLIKVLTIKKWNSLSCGHNRVLFTFKKCFKKT